MSDNDFARVLDKFRRQVLALHMEINKRLNVLQDSVDNLGDDMADRFDGVNADFKALADGIDALKAEIVKVDADVTSLDDMITKLSGQVVTDEQVAALQAQADALVTSFGAAKDALQAVDDRTPEAPPVEPPVEPPTFR
jgi:uncharacterized coiled-coil protein SlyX